MIALGEARHATPDIDDDAGPLVPEDRRKEPLRIGSRQGKLVGMADPCRLDLDQDLPVFWTIEPNPLDPERLSGFVSDSSAGLHDRLLPLG